MEIQKMSEKMKRFEFLIGDWELSYRVPKSPFSAAAEGTGRGTFSRVLNGRYVQFDYKCSLTHGKAEAHAIFAWDERSGIYRYWWFEDSGAFMTATCDFLTPDLLYLNWHDSQLKQTFERISEREVLLQMEQPSAQDDYELVLEVTLTRA
jgi:hypothetical protein